MEIERPPYLITTDPARFDLDTIWAWLGRSYWAAGFMEIHQPDVYRQKDARAGG